jgi:TnpA family transposase
LAIAIRDALRSGDLHLAESRKHVSFWNLVYDEKKWEKEKPKAYSSLALPSKANELFDELRNEYTESLEKAKRALPGSSVFTITDGKIHLKKPDALEIPEGSRQLRAAIESNIRHIRIEDLLQEVDRACAFTREFRPLGGYKSRAKNLYITILANLIAQGTNLGIAAMANSVDDLSIDMLQHANQWFFSLESQKAANKVLVDYHHSLPLTNLYGTGELSSSDGQRFGVQQSSLLASFYPRYFGYYDRAITLYTHISDQYSVFSTQAISCGPREALHVLDGLLDNQTVLCPREHTTDTHGFTEQLFGLCYLLGFSFMPRLKDLPDQRLYKFDNSIDMGEFEPVFESPIDLALISEQWDQLVRVAASLRSKVAPAHVVLHRLVNASPSDRVAKALTALGRLVKTIYLMGYIADPALRRKVHKQLNRGEGRHDLAKWLFFANRGVFRTGDYEEIMNKASCLSLLSNAVLVWNTMEIDKIVHSLRLSGQIVNDADLALVAPLLRYHVAPNGTYFNNKGPSNQPIITVFDR